MQEPKQKVSIRDVLQQLKDDVDLLQPEQHIQINSVEAYDYNGWPDLLQRALDNLLRNAVRFNPVPQPIYIDLQRHSSNLSITIRDHGPGVAEEWLEQLGDSFFRVPGQSQQGYGLGLAIAKRAIEQHAGQLTFSNHPEGGFIARVQLPLAD